MPPSSRQILVVTALAFVVAAAALAGGGATHAGDASCSGLDPAACVAPAIAPQEESAAEQLAARHAPIVYLKNQDEACDKSGEAYRPMEVEAVLGNQEVSLKQDVSGQPVVAEAPLASDLFGKGDDYYLDFPGNPRNPGCRYEEDFKALDPEHPDPVVYARVLHEPGYEDLLVLQYWYYFYFNDWNNNHESDWEMIQLIFEAGSPEEALTKEPDRVNYAQHGSGERADWDDAKLKKDDARPIVYIAAGSHASQFDGQNYLGRGEAGTGFGCDDATGPSRRLELEARLIPDTVSGPDDPYAWITYEGRWGEKQSGEFNGPTGPNTKTQWTTPITWEEEKMRDSSVEVPETLLPGATAVDAFCSVVAWGSNLIFSTAPFVLLALGIAIVGGIATTLRRTRFRPVVEEPLAQRRTFGQIIRTAFRIQRRHWRLFLGIGVVFIPLGALSTLLQFGFFYWQPVDALLDLMDSRVINGLLALLVGVLGVGTAYWLVLCAVIAANGELEAGRRVSIARSFRIVLHRLWPLVGARLGATAAVLGMGITAVGLPFAFYFGARWAFLEQAVLLRGASARESFGISSALAKGQVLRILGTVVVVAGLGLATGPLVGIALLLLSSASLTGINAISSAIYVAFIPYVAIALMLLYYDLATRKSEAAPEATG